ncbi:8853_t:CDS:2, partial [Gigaspora rosea]
LGSYYKGMDIKGDAFKATFIHPQRYDVGHKAFEWYMKNAEKTRQRETMSLRIVM